MKKELLTTILVIFSAMMAAAGNGIENGSVQGTVINAETRKPVANATFSATIHKSSFQKEFVTDQYGNFRIQNVPPGEHVLIIDRRGYKACRKEGIFIKEGAVFKIVFEVLEDETELHNPFLTPITIHSF
jgi:hypothetical protein